MQTTGSRAQVMHGTAHHTAGGLTKSDLKYNKAGRIVSRKKSMKAKKEKRLEKAGYKTRKGHFGAVKKD
jgi:DVNP family